MNYIIEIKLHQGQTRKYFISAADEKEVIEKVKLRLLPYDRERLNVLSIRPDFSKPADDDAYGTFLN